jgi:hypothetical protein
MNEIRGLLGEQLENGKILIFICNVILRYKNAKKTLQEESVDLPWERRGGEKNTLAGR